MVRGPMAVVRVGGGLVVGLVRVGLRVGVVVVHRLLLLAAHFAGDLCLAAAADTHIAEALGVLL